MLGRIAAAVMLCLALMVPAHAQWINHPSAGRSENQGWQAEPFGPGSHNDGREARSFRHLDHR